MLASDCFDRHCPRNPGHRRSGRWGQTLPVVWSVWRSSGPVTRTTLWQHWSLAGPGPDPGNWVVHGTGSGPAPRRIQERRLDTDRNQESPPAAARTEKDTTRSGTRRWRKCWGPGILPGNLRHPYRGRAEEDGRGWRKRLCWHPWCCTLARRRPCHRILETGEIRPTENWCSRCRGSILETEVGDPCWRETVQRRTRRNHHVGSGTGPWWRGGRPAWCHSASGSAEPRTPTLVLQNQTCKRSVSPEFWSRYSYHNNTWAREKTLLITIRKFSFHTYLSARLSLS